MIIGKVLETDIKVRVEEDESNPSRATFKIQPLSSGFGTTVGNALRRVLLSSLSTYAVVGIRVEGASHEYDTLEGVVEDVSDIILNLRDLVFMADPNDETVHTATLQLEGPCTATAADLHLPPKLGVLNPDAPIAQIDEGGTLEMEMVLMRGRGFVIAHDIELPEEYDYVGMIPVDSVFTPVTKVNFKVEETRVGRMTNFDKLILSVETNGSISARDAVERSSSTLIDFLSVISSAEARRTTAQEREDEERRRLRELLSTPVAELELTVRSTNCLKAADIHNLGDLVEKNEPEMLKYRNFGKKSLGEVNVLLQQYGLELGMNLAELLGETEG